MSKGYWKFYRHPRTGCEIRVHSAEVGIQEIYLRWSWLEFKAKAMRLG